MMVVEDALPIAFSGTPLDRADQVRADPAALAALVNGDARVLQLEGLSPRISEDGGLAWGTLEDCAPHSELVFLGLAGDRAHFAVVDPALVGSVAPPAPDLWDALRQLGPEDLAIYGGARSLVDWHVRHRFCARCGGPTAIAKGGWQRTCVREACGAEHFPRVDPVTIMLVEHEDSLLLGRQPRFTPGLYSALAGFVEPGETVEEAVAREVLEEAGVRVRDVRYVASQPWPFPSSLMIGCHAMADDPAICIDVTELEDARWFSRADVARAMHGEADAPFQIPPPRAIAHQLMRWWLDRG